MRKGFGNVCVVFAFLFALLHGMDGALVAFALLALGYFLRRPEKNQIHAE